MIWQGQNGRKSVGCPGSRARWSDNLPSLYSHWEPKVQPPALVMPKSFGGRDTADVHEVNILKWRKCKAWSNPIKYSYSL